MAGVTVTSRRMCGRQVEVEYSLDREGNVWLSDVWFAGQALDALWLSSGVREELTGLVRDCLEGSWEDRADGADGPDGPDTRKQAA